MSDQQQSGCSSMAVEEALGLLQPSVSSRQQVGAGYVDLLGGRDPIGSSFAQQTMRNRVVPRIYERLWRPLVSRLFFGMRGPGSAAERRIALGMLDVSDGDRVLDIGCGPGTYTRHLARAAGNGLVVGLDASEPMLAAAVRRADRPNLAYMRGDASALPFERAEFDAVSCYGTLHLVEGPMEALDEMVRVLAPGGRLGLLATCASEGPPRREPKGIRVFGRDELTGALADRGLVDIEQKVVGRGQFVAARRSEG